MSDTPKPEVTNEKAPVSATPEPGNGGKPRATATSTRPVQISEAEQREIDRELEEMMSDVSGSAGAADRTSPTMTPPGESIEPGTKMTGTIAGVSDEEVFVEFGAKCQGVLERGQFTKKETVEVGARVEVIADRYDEDSALLILRRPGVIQKATWDTLSQGAVVEGRVTGMIRGGLEVDLQGIRGFMPASQASLAPMKDVSELLNQKIQCEVVEIHKRSKNVIVSRRRLLEREAAAKREKLEAELEVGQIRKGVVRNITAFGAFVDLGGLEGLVHIREMSWGTVEKVSDVLTTGQEVEVKVLKIDKERGRLSLGLKHAQPDPWINVGDRFPEGTELKARVVRVLDFGAFAEIEPGVEALIPISEMGWTRTNRTEDAVSVGDMVNVKVMRVELKKRRIALSMKQAQPDPWAGVLESFTPQSLVKGKVTKLTDFGAFVEIAPGIEGMVHISEISDGHVRTCGDVLTVGQEIETRVLGVDSEKRRISLSIKQVKSPEAGSDAEAAQAEDHQPKKRRKPLRGGLSSHYDW